MIIKFLLKIWPALLPILVYFLSIILQKVIRNIFKKKAGKKIGKIINATYHEVKSKNEIQNEEDLNKANYKIGNFSLQNQYFIMVLYLSFFISIMCFLFFAIRPPKIEEGRYIPAHIKDGKVIPWKIIDEK